MYIMHTVYFTAEKLCNVTTVYTSGYPEYYTDYKVMVLDISVRKHETVIPLEFIVLENFRDLTCT